MKNLLLITIFLLQFGYLTAQKDEVNQYLRLVAYGKIDEVKSKLPDLLAKYPNDPGVKLLHGTLLEDANLALTMYKAIIKDYPASEWADQAYWRIIQYYAITNDITKAQEELSNFRSRYPASPFITPAADIVRTAWELNKRNYTSSNNVTVAKPSTSPIEKKETETISKFDESKAKVISSTTESKITPLQRAETAELTSIVQAPKNKNTTVNSIKLKDENNSVADLNSISQKQTKVDSNNISSNTKKSEEPAFWGLQVGIYKDKNSAESEKEKFLVKRLRTSVVEKVVNGITMYAVVIGHYSTLESAEEGKKIVSIQCGCDPIIYQK